MVCIVVLAHFLLDMKNQGESLFKIVLLSGKQGIAFHGHRDDHIAWFENCDIN